MTDALQPGQRIRQFLIDAPLGRGGQAVTWLATDETTGDRVVVKQLTLKTAETWKEIELFEREARTLRSLDHAAIPPFRDAFEERSDDGSVDFFLVQDWIDAPSLAERIARWERFDLERFTSIATQALDVLGWLHARMPPVIHRDIKPSNLLVDAHGVLHFIDFGAVKAHLSVTGSGESTVVGTHGYMPPEQLMGHASPASDLYALGATLVHMASGHHPATLPVDGLRLVFAHVVNVPPAVVAWLEFMLSPDPRERPASATIAKTKLFEALRPQATPVARPAPAPPEGGGGAAFLFVAIGALGVLGAVVAALVMN